MPIVGGWIVGSGGKEVLVDDQEPPPQPVLFFKGRDFIFQNALAFCMTHHRTAHQSFNTLGIIEATTLPFLKPN